MVLPPRGDTLDALAFGILSRTERDEGEEVIVAMWESETDSDSECALLSMAGGISSKGATGVSLAAGQRG